VGSSPTRPTTADQRECVSPRLSNAKRDITPGISRLLPCRCDSGEQPSARDIETLPGGGYRVRIYAGIDPVTKQRHYLRETVKQGPRAKQEAEKVRTRLLHRVGGKRNPRTTATVNQLIHRWLEVVDVEASTRRGYERKIRKHIRPLLGGLQVGRLDVEALESF